MKERKEIEKNEIEKNAGDGLNPEYITGFEMDGMSTIGNVYTNHKTIYLDHRCFHDLIEGISDEDGYIHLPIEITNEDGYIHVVGE